MGVRHRSSLPNGILHVDDLEALGLTPASTAPLHGLATWLEGLGVHLSRVAAVKVKHGAVKLLLNVRADAVLDAEGTPVLDATNMPRTKTVRQWLNVPSAPPPPLYVWAPLLAAVNAAGATYGPPTLVELDGQDITEHVTSIEMEAARG